MQEEEKISKMDAILFVINLEVAYLQIHIVEGCAKYNELHNSIRSKRENLQRTKLAKERNMIKDILRRTLVELIDDGEWPTLQKTLILLGRNASYEVELRRDHDELKLSLDTIITKLMIIRQESTMNMRMCERNIAILKDEIKDVMWNTNIQLSYVDKWLLAKSESLDLQHRIEITPAPKLNVEKRVHEQVVNIYELQIKEREASVEYWKVRYTRDLIDIIERLKKQCEKLRRAAERRHELQKLYDLHEGEMRAWLTFKQDRAARLAREERSRLASTRIQAWWRGVMVRRCLGAFRQLKNAKKLPSKLKKK